MTHFWFSRGYLNVLILPSSQRILYMLTCSKLTPMNQREIFYLRVEREKGGEARLLSGQRSKDGLGFVDVAEIVAADVSPPLVLCL